MVEGVYKIFVDGRCRQPRSRIGIGKDEGGGCVGDVVGFGEWIAAICIRSSVLWSILHGEEQTYTVPVSFKAILDVAGANPDSGVDAAAVPEVSATANEYVKYMEDMVTCMFQRS